VKQTRIDEVAAAHATAPKTHRADEVRPRGSMEDVEAAHATVKQDPAVAKAKAGKQRIDPAAFGVEVEGAPVAAKPVAVPAPKRGRKPGAARKPAEPSEE